MCYIKRPIIKRFYKQDYTTKKKRLKYKQRLRNHVKTKKGLKEINTQCVYAAASMQKNKS